MRQLVHRIKPIIFLVGLFSLFACAPNAIKQKQRVDFTGAGRIELQITADNPAILPTGINQQVTKNLADWHYPIGDQTGLTTSHVLTANVGAIVYGNTPAGFSFSAGNSDPRALDFQKTDVLPITCTLSSQAHPDQHTDLSMGFTANRTDRRALAADKLTDHISTVCFNLLQESKWPLAEKSADSVTVTPSWIPEVRIENKVTAKDKAAQPATALPEEEEPRKEIIIHNQGSPVILHFGHERR